MLGSLTLSAVLAVAAGLGSYWAFDSGTALKHMFIAGAVPLVLRALMKRQRPDAQRSPDGWHRLRPSVLHWIGLVLCLGLTALMLYVWLFVGSSRADAGTQMKILLGLILAGSAGSLYMLAVCFLVRIRWNDGRIERWIGPRMSTAIPFTEIASVDATPGEMIRIVARDGSRIAVDPSLNGSNDLLHRLEPHIEWRADRPAEA